MHLEFMCQAHLVPVAFQAPKGTRESQEIFILDPQVLMGILVI